MRRLLNIFFILTLFLFSCGKSEKSAVKKAEVIGEPCNVKIEIFGKAPQVQFKCFAKAKEKAVSIDRQINVLDKEKDEFSFSSYTGGKLSCELKTNDSYGPEVTLKVYVNGKFWKEETGQYNPKIEGLIPRDIQ